VARIVVFDTTLRDGEQSPGFSMTRGQKLRMAHALAELRADVIEAGFPAASEDDFGAVRDIAEAVRDSSICALARCHPTDISRAAAALEKASAPRLHVFIATSPIHRKHKLEMSRDEVLARAVDGVHQARKYVDDVEFSAEDAIRTEIDFLARISAAAIEAGARTINIPDTVGYTTPLEMTRLITRLRSMVANIDQAVISTHCHNDLGMAVANSLAAVEAGARQVECTVNGIGERAGNCALEELVMALRTRRDHYHGHTRINTRRLCPTSHLLASITGSEIPRNKAVVGSNAFAHEAGIHQHGVMCHPETYEIMQAEAVGASCSTLVLGKHSGRHAIAERIATLGFHLDAKQLNQLFQRFKHLTDHKKCISDSDLEGLLEGADEQAGGPWSFLNLRADSGIGPQATPTAVVSLAHRDGHCVREAATGDGALDAVCRAIARATDLPLVIESLTVRSSAEGPDRHGEATIHAHCREREFTGVGMDTDLVAAVGNALLQIVNRIARCGAQPSDIRQSMSL